MIKYFVTRNFRGTCSSVEMLKGCMLIFQNAEGYMLIYRIAEGVHAYLSKCWRVHAYLSKCWRVHAHLSDCWRGTCLSIGLLKGYMVRDRMGTPALE